MCFRETQLLMALHKLQQVGLAHAHQLYHFLVTALYITTATWETPKVQVIRSQNLEL